MHVLAVHQFVGVPNHVPGNYNIFEDVHLYEIAVEEERGIRPVPVPRVEVFCPVICIQRL